MFGQKKKEVFKEKAALCRGGFFLTSKDREVSNGGIRITLNCHIVLSKTFKLNIFISLQSSCSCNAEFFHVTKFVCEPVEHSLVENAPAILPQAMGINPNVFN